MSNKTGLSIEQLRQICQPKEITERSTEDWYAKLIGRKISIYFTKVCISIGFSPNAISVLSIFAAVFGGLIFAKADLFSLTSFFVLLQFSFILDSCDGEVARYSKEYTKLGAFLEKVSSTITSVALYLGLAIGVFVATENYVYLYLGLAGAILDTLRDVIIYSKNIEVPQIEQKDKFGLQNSHKDRIGLLYRIYSSLKVNELCYPRGRVIVLFIIALLNFWFIFPFFEYMLATFVCLSAVIFIFTLFVMYAGYKDQRTNHRQRLGLK
jgi:phosphatidylglycerophosphate synthase